VVYNIPDSVNRFPENVNSQNISKEIMVGRNDFGRSNYGGPCPPSGTHRYYFKIYGLDDVLHQAKPELRKHQLLKLMEGHVIESGQLMGKYQRKR
jgi:Raf kinase inhibitor-like YbhB/YbcL family protein